MALPKTNSPPERWSSASRTFSLTSKCGFRDPRPTERGSGSSSMSSCWSSVCASFAAATFGGRSGGLGYRSCVTRLLCVRASACVRAFVSSFFRAFVRAGVRARVRAWCQHVCVYYVRTRVRVCLSCVCARVQGVARDENGTAAFLPLLTLNPPPRARFRTLISTHPPFLFPSVCLSCSVCLSFSPLIDD